MKVGSDTVFESDTENVYHIANANASGVFGSNDTESIIESIIESANANAAGGGNLRLNFRRQTQTDLGLKFLT